METIFQNMTQKSTRPKICEIPIIKTDPKTKLKIPKYETKGSVGLDLTANLENKKAFSLKPGREVGKIKKAIEEAILDGKIPNEHKAAYEFMLKMKKTQTSSTMLFH